jgi:hypothetical protein
MLVQHLLQLHVQLLLSAGRNLGYFQGGEKDLGYQRLAAYLDNPSCAESWLQLLLQDPGKVRKASGFLAKVFGLNTTIPKVALHYLETVPVEKLEERTFFAAIQLANLDEEGKLKVQEKREKAIEKNTETENQKAKERREHYRQQGQLYLQIGAYFCSEIPDSSLRMDMLMLLAECAQEMGIHEDEAPKHMEPALLEKTMQKIRAQAMKIVTIVNESETGEKIPTSFEESLDPKYREQIVLIRQQIQSILEPISASIEKIVPGAVLRYRGSLTDGIKNFTKSKPLNVIDSLTGDVIKITEIDFGKKAIPVNLEAFDLDAFIEIPMDLWTEWEQAGLMLDRKESPIKGKLLLEQWLGHLNKLTETNSKAGPAIDIVVQLLQLEKIAQIELLKVKGYKTKETGNKETVADFEMVLQSPNKTRKEKEYGKPYPLGELSRGGSAYEELMARFDLLQEHELNVLAAWVDEVNGTITKE